MFPRWLALPFVPGLRGGGGGGGTGPKCALGFPHGWAGTLTFTGGPNWLYFQTNERQQVIPETRITHLPDARIPLKATRQALICPKSPPFPPKGSSLLREAHGPCWATGRLLCPSLPGLASPATLLPELKTRRNNAVN